MTERIGGRQEKIIAAVGGVQLSRGEALNYLFYILCTVRFIQLLKLHANKLQLLDTGLFISRKLADKFPSRFDGTMMVARRIVRQCKHSQNLTSLERRCCTEFPKFNNSANFSLPIAPIRKIPPNEIGAVLE